MVTILSSGLALLPSYGQKEPLVFQDSTAIIIDQSFELVDKSFITSGLWYDRSMPYARLREHGHFAARPVEVSAADEGGSLGGVKVG